MAGKFIARLSIHFMEIHQVALTVPGRMAAPGTARLETDIHRGEAREGTADIEAQGWRQEAQRRQLTLPASVCSALKWNRTSEHPPL